MCLRLSRPALFHTIGDIRIAFANASKTEELTPFPITSFSNSFCFALLRGAT